MAVKNSSRAYQQQIPSFSPQLPPDEIEVDEEDKAFKPIDIDELDEKTNQQLTDFSGLLDTLSSIEDKQKALWKQIYENAVQDRKNAYIMWSDLYAFVHTKANEHAIHGQNLTRYMERMGKANDQILKLTELVAAATEEEIEESLTEDDVYNQIQSKNSG